MSSCFALEFDYNIKGSTYQVEVRVLRYVPSMHRVQTRAECEPARPGAGVVSVRAGAAEHATGRRIRCMHCETAIDSRL